MYWSTLPPCIKFCDLVGYPICCNIRFCNFFTESVSFAQSNFFFQQGFCQKLGSSGDLPGIHILLPTENGLSMDLQILLTAECALHSLHCGRCFPWSDRPCCARIHPLRSRIPLFFSYSWCKPSSSTLLSPRTKLGLL